MSVQSACASPAWAARRELGELGCRVKRSTELKSYQPSAALDTCIMLEVRQVRPRRRGCWRVEVCAAAALLHTTLVPRRFPLPMPWSCAQLEP